MEDLSNNEYLRQRLKPQAGDPLYLPLSDLLIAVQSLLPANCSRVLDYGSGGSPYRSLFGAATYHRADLAGGSDLDFEYGADARLPAEANDYDCVLSSQVLEHVENPATYLQECYRVMRPGGYLLLTTHGTFADHGCPYDYWRWTGFGLRRLVENAGFKISALKKITTGPRCALFLSEQEFGRLKFRGSGIYGLSLSLGIRAVRWIGARRLHDASDQGFAQYRVVDADQDDNDTYVGIGLLASR